MWYNDCKVAAGCHTKYVLNDFWNVDFYVLKTNQIWVKESKTSCLNIWTKIFKYTYMKKKMGN